METKAKTPLYAIFMKYRELGLLIVMATLILIVSLRTPAFFTGAKMLFIVEDTSIMIVLAAGMMCVLLVGSIDISIAAIMALSAMVTGVIMRSQITETDVIRIVNGVETTLAYRESVPILLLLLIGMTVGGLCGAVNGLLISYGRVLPIVATLGMQYILYGISHIVGNNTAVYRKDMSDDFVQFTRWEPLGIDTKIWIMAAVVLLVFLFATYLRSGRHLYAVGSNREAAEMRGINANRTILTAHIIMGVLAGLAGLMYGSRDTKITQDMANGYEMFVIAACVIGGVAVTGGSGRITGVVLGALTIGIINNGLPMLRLVGNAEFWKKAIQGALILIAVVSNVLMQRSMNRQNLKRRRI
ncbi:MAG: ABC transporter permease [Christensenellales bacterium]|jgi:rhamnose transport system permease protein